MEQALGADLGGVRVHTDGRADELNRLLTARAFTTGHEIFLRRGEYDLGSRAGRELLAHELTHVVQQQGAPAGAVVQREPVKRKDGTYTDSKIPGATLQTTGSKDSTGNVGYQIVETAEKFDYNPATGTYSQRGTKIKPADLAPGRKRTPAKPKKKYVSSDSSEEQPRRPVKTVKRKQVSSESSEEPKKSQTRLLKREKDRPPEPKKQQTRMKKQRTAEFDPYFSDMSASEDDERVNLTPGQMLAKLRTYRALKRKSLSDITLPKAGTDFVLDDPHVRKGFAAHRTTPGDLIVDINVLQAGQIGEQRLHLQHGRGHLVTAGGNPGRSNIKEPPQDYKEMFESIKKLGKDENAKTLLTQAGGTAGDIRGADLSDRQVAAIVLHNMNTSTDKTLPRTQLTENLGKLNAIFMSETARSFEAEGGPYDATVLIKAGLQNVIDNKLSLAELFYRGTRGSESVFLGAPSEGHSSSRIGGAKQLRNPESYETALERQMAVFPSNKGQFKALIRRTKSGTSIQLPKLTAEDLRQAAQKAEESQTEQAEALLKAARAITVPTKIEGVLDFLDKRRGPVNKVRIEVKNLRGRVKGNEGALAKLTEADETLDEKVEAANQVGK